MCTAVVLVAGAVFAVALASIRPRPADASALPVVYLTFDDGPSPFTGRLLDLLAAHHAHATFFVVGQYVAGSGDLVRRALAEGHAVGNHTWSHVELPRQSDDVVRRQLTATNDVVAAAGGHATCFRPPYGATDDRVAGIGRSLGLRQVLWTVDTRDWEHQDTAAILGHIGKPRDGMIVLMHDGGGGRTATLAATSTLLDRWAGKVRFEAIPDCRPPDGSPPSEVALPSVAGDGLGLVPLPPQRLLDTRATRALGAGETVRIAVPDRAADAAAIDLVAVDATFAGFVQAWDCGGEPTTSVINMPPAVARAGSATVELQHGEFCVRASTATNLIVDLTAVFRPDGGRARLVAYRAADTRTSTPVGPSWRPLATSFPDGVSAVSVVVATADRGEDADFVSVLPCAAVTSPDMPPPVSVLNGAGRVANLLDVATTGGLCAYASRPREILIDVVTEWGAGALVFRPIPPTRILDTRLGLGHRGRLDPGLWNSVVFEDAPPPAGLFGTLTTVGADDEGYATVAASGDGPPAISTVQLDTGDDAAEAPVAGASLAVFTSSGTDAVFDVTGVFVTGG